MVDHHKTDELRSFNDLRHDKKNFPLYGKKMGETVVHVNIFIGIYSQMSYSDPWLPVLVGLTAATEVPDRIGRRSANIPNAAN